MATEAGGKNASTTERLLTMGGQRGKREGVENGKGESGGEEGNVVDKGQANVRRSRSRGRSRKQKQSRRRAAA